MMGTVGCYLSMALSGLGVSLADAGAAPIVASPGALLLKAVQGQTATGTLLLTKSGSDQHTYYLSTNQGWIWMNPPYGSTQTISTETDSLSITAQTTGLAPGIYSAVVYVGDSGPDGFSNLLRIPVSLTVTAAAPGTPPPTPPAPMPPPPTPPSAAACGRSPTSTTRTAAGAHAIRGPRAPPWSAPT